MYLGDQNSGHFAIAICFWRVVVTHSYPLLTTTIFTTHEQLGQIQIISCVTKIEPLLESMKNQFRIVLVFIYVTH